MARYRMENSEPLLTIEKTWGGLPEGWTVNYDHGDRGGIVVDTGEIMAPAVERWLAEDGAVTDGRSADLAMCRLLDRDEWRALHGVDNRTLTKILRKARREADLGIHGPGAGIEQAVQQVAAQHDVSMTALNAAREQRTNHVLNWVLGDAANEASVGYDFETEVAHAAQEHGVLIEDVNQAREQRAEATRVHNRHEARALALSEEAARTADRSVEHAEDPHRWNVEHDLRLREMCAEQDIDPAEVEHWCEIDNERTTEQIMQEAAADHAVDVARMDAIIEEAGRASGPVYAELEATCAKTGISESDAYDRAHAVYCQRRSELAESHGVPVWEIAEREVERKQIEINKMIENDQAWWDAVARGEEFSTREHDPERARVLAVHEAAVRAGEYEGHEAYQARLGEMCAEQNLVPDRVERVGEFQDHVDAQRQREREAERSRDDDGLEIAF